MLHSKPYNSTHTHLNPFTKISSSDTIPPPSETHTCSRGKGTSTSKCTITSSRTYNHHWYMNTTCRQQLTVDQLLTSPKEAYTSLKEEVGLFIIRQFLSQSQDGATILLKKLKIKTFIFKTKDKNSFSALRISEKDQGKENNWWGNKENC